MNKIIIIVALSALLIGAVYAGINENNKVVELNKQLDDKNKVIDKLKSDALADNAIQADLQSIIKSITGLGNSVNGNLQKILNKPVYNIVCSDPDGVREVNRYTGKTPATAGASR